VYTVERAMRLEAPMDTATLLLKVSRRLKAGELVLPVESVLGRTEVLALSEISVGVAPSTNEVPHSDSRTDLADATEEGSFWAQILYVSLMQSVQVTLEGNEGGIEKILAISPRVSGPVTVWTSVRVSVTHSVLPCFRQSTWRTVGYNASTSGIGEEVLGKPAAANSAEQPVVRFWTTAARVALLQAGSLHMLVTQVSRG